MEIVNDIYNFVALHKAAFFLAFAWAVREWTTVKGWRGLKCWFITGSINEPPKEEKV